MALDAPQWFRWLSQGVGWTKWHHRAQTPNRTLCGRMPVIMHDSEDLTGSLDPRDACTHCLIVLRSRNELVWCPGPHLPRDHPGWGRLLDAVSGTVDHPRIRDFWRHEPPNPRPCIECGEETPWIYLDIGHLHPSCDLDFGRPSEDRSS